MSYSIYIYTSLIKKKGLFLKEKKQDIFNIAIKTQHLLQQASNIFLSWLPGGQILFCLRIQCLIFSCCEGVYTATERSKGLLFLVVVVFL